MAESSSLSPHSSPMEANQSAPSEPPSPATPTSSAPDNSEETSRRRRGRPAGSKNKPKQQLSITRQLEPAIKTVQFEFPSGCDIVEMLEKFARKHRVGLRILDGSGCVCSFALQNNSFMPTGILTLVTLSGTFMDPTMMASSSSSATGALLSFHPSSLGPWLSVIATTGSTMELIGGVVASKVQAASNVVVHVLTFKSIEPQLLDPAEYATIPEHDGSSRGGGLGSGLVGGGGDGGVIGSGGFGGIGGGALESGLVGGGGGSGVVGGVGVAPVAPGFGVPTLQQNWGFPRGI